MLDFLMLTVLPIIIYILMAFLLLLLGAMVASASMTGGRAGVMTAGIAIGAFSGAILGFGTYFMVDIDYSYRAYAESAGYVSGVIGFATGLIPALHLVLTGGKWAEYLRQIAPVVKEIGLASFAETDLDGNGTLTTKELAITLEKLSVDPRDRRRILRHIHDEISEVGHVIDSYTTTGFIFIANPKGGGMMVPTTTTHYVYGVSREDLESYPERIIHKYRRW